MSNRAGAGIVQRKSCSLPVAAAAHFFELAQDPFFVLFFPLPDPLDQSFTAEIVTSFVFGFPDPFFNTSLSRNSGVIGAGHPQRVIALHSLEPDYYILQCIVERVSEVECSGHVGRWDDDRKRLLVRIGFAVKVTTVFPHFEQAFLCGGKVESCGDIV